MNRFLICIDDTDSLESIGTGELADEMMQTIHHHNWGETTRVTRHQLFVHDDIPYTSHNSSMCFTATIKEDCIEKTKKHFISFLENRHAKGSDPGLCMVNLDHFSAFEELISFGKRAKNEILTKSEAYDFAQKHHIHLSEHGGTGIGVIGALAGCGLRLSGHDGRFRGKTFMPSPIMSVKQLQLNPSIDIVQTINGKHLSLDEQIEVGQKVKTVHLYHKAVLLVEKNDKPSGPIWVVIPKEKLKNY